MAVPAGRCHSFYRDVALPGMARGEQWHWSIRTRERPDRLIGSIALISDASEHPNNRGFWIGAPYQRQGYATEACLAVTDFWFRTLGFPVLIVPKAAVNEASRRISEKTGMTLLRTETHRFVSGELPAEIWQVTAEEWRRFRATAP